SSASKPAESPAAGSSYELCGMTGPLLTAVLVGSLGLAVWASPMVRAEGGQLSFRGAIVAPTCKPTPSYLDAIASADGTTRSGRFACPMALEKSADPARVYRMTVTALPAGSPDRLLNYYAGYMQADDATPARVQLITQTYE
ncbi:MAG TPA: hypothetical protein VN043_13165, partial [Rhodanobacter sp.]|nr:hypothetical protein [Rhodanobacter sp.]